MEKRKMRRVSAQGNLSGRMVLAADLGIRDLSFSGIRFICSERVAPGSQVQLLIHEESVSVLMDCTVVRSSLRGAGTGTLPGPPSTRWAPLSAVSTVRRGRGLKGSWTF